MVVHTCNPSIWKAEKGGRISLGPTGARVRPYLKKLRKIGREGGRKKEKEEGGRSGEGGGERRREGILDWRVARKDRKPVPAAVQNRLTTSISVTLPH